MQSATEDGKKNAERNHVENIEFVNSKVEDFVEEFSKNLSQAEQKTTIILDPPRDGLHPKAIPYILALGADEIIYVSCNPATLVRDIAIMLGKTPEKEDEDEKSHQDEKSEKASLKKYSYIITDITPMDMFPHTHHIETVVRMERV